jgi:hypothetical protein
VGGKILELLRGVLELVAEVEVVVGFGSTLTSLVLVLLGVEYVIYGRAWW